MKGVRFWLTVFSLILLMGCATTSEEARRNARAAELNVQLGLDYLEQGRLDLAETKLKRALQQDPHNSLVNWSYALLQERLEEDHKAEKYYRRAIELNPKDSEAMNNYATFLCKRDRLKEAYRIFERAANNLLYPQREVVYFNAGLCASRHDDALKAENYFSKALEIRPNYASALYQMGLLTFKQKRYLASRAYRKRLEQVMKKPDPKVLWLCVVNERAMANYTEADRCERQLKTQFPTSSEATSLF